MIPILYEHNESTFNTFGIGPLAETSSCEVTEERNGAYELVLKYPTNGRMINEITKERLLRVQVNDNKSIQTFRIYRITVPISGIVTVYAQHISYDLSGVVVFPCTVGGSNPSQIMNYIRENKTDRYVPFAFLSDISDVGSLVVENPRTFRSVLGGDKESIATTFKGEFLWDNFTVRYLANRGSDNGITILYGKNLTKLEHNSDLSGIYSDLCPYAKVTEGENIYYLQLTEKTLPFVTTLQEKKVLIKDFSSMFGSGEGKLEPTEANLRQVANDFILANPLGIEIPNITLSFEQLRGQFGYSNLHETVNLCDTVTVKYPDLGIDIKTKIVKVVYDVLKEKFKSVTLGAVKASLVDTTTSTKQEADATSQAMTEVPSYVEQAINHATSQITGANGGCVRIDMDNQSRPYELLVMDDYDIEDATKVWRWNINGLGYSPNGYNGPYTTAITSDGHIVADFIDTGTLTAGILKAGTIQALSGDSYWNLETGVLNLTGEINATSGTFSNVTIGDTCNIYGNLWMEGEVTVGDRWGGAAYDCVTRVGGDGIQSEMEVRTYNAYGHPTYNIDAEGYITPIGTIMVPKGREDHYNDKYGDMAFGISYDYSFLASHMLAGLHVALRQIEDPTYETYDAVQLHLTARGDIIELSYDSRHADRAYCYWGSSMYPNYLSSEFWIGDRDRGKNSAISALLEDNKQYGQLKGKWIVDEKLYFGDSVAGGNCLTNLQVSTLKYPCLAGVWYAGTLRFGSEYNNSYHTKLDQDQMTFYYGSTEVGDIECYQQYVDIQGTWKTNGNNWISTSDIKTKNTIEELDDRYSVLFSNLQPRSFKFNDGKSGRTHTGFIVQEVLDALEKAGISSDEYGLCCAFGDKNNPETVWGLRYEEIIALCVKEIQSLRKEVQELKEEKK